MLDMVSLNWIAVAVAAVIGMALGALWYSPVLFGNAWLKALGKTEEELSSPGPAMAGGLFASAASAVTMALLIAAAGVTGYAAGAGFGLLCGLGLVATAFLSDSLFCGWGWPLFLIQAGYRVTYLVLMGAVLGGWQ